MYQCGICEDISFDQSIICKRDMAHRNCDGTLQLINRSTMTCTSEEKEVYANFQRERDSKIKLINMTYKQKIESQRQ